MCNNVVMKHMKTVVNSAYLSICYAACLFLLVACDRDESSREKSKPFAGIGKFTEEFADPELEAFTGDLNKMKQRRLIRALVTPSPTEFFIESGRVRGIQAEYLQEFAKHINKSVRNETDKIRIKYVPVPFSELIPALKAGRGDIAASFLTVTKKRSKQILFAAPFRDDVNEIIVTHNKEPDLNSIEDLAGREVYVLANSSYAEHLAELNEEFQDKGLEPMVIEEADPHLLSEDILEFVNAGVIEMMIIDNYIGKLWVKVLKNITLHESMEVTEDNQVAWAVRKDSTQLKSAIDTYIKGVRDGALLGNILFQRYYDNIEWIKNPIAESERDKLNRYREYFEKYGNKYDFDPLALAAQAYQESGLEHNRKSPAGAVGVMQVLPSTASDPKVNIKNIKDPERNIHAGTKYLAFVRDRYFGESEISDWDRQAFVWASYNAGPKKIRQARALAKKMGLNPNTWFGNVEVATAKLVGREPVRYVANIYRYFVAYRLLQLQSEKREAATKLL